MVTKNWLMETGLAGIKSNLACKMTGEYVKISWCIKCPCLDLCFSDDQDVSLSGMRWGEVVSRSDLKGQCNSMRYRPETVSCLRMRVWAAGGC